MDDVIVKVDHLPSVGAKMVLPYAWFQIRGCLVITREKGQFLMLEPW
jgi:hypothetical protein